MLARRPRGARNLADAAPGLVVVTGANGHLGRALLHTLSGRRPLRAVVRSAAAAAAVRALPTPPEVAVVDYRSPEALARASAGAEAVVHLVGVIKATRRAPYAAAHEEPARALAEAAKRSGFRRTVYLSILGADPASPNACLASRGRTEAILLESPLATTVLRVPMVLGGDDPATAALRARARGSWVFLVRGGAALEQPIDAADVVAAIVAALDRPELAGRVLDLAGPEALPRRELVGRAAALLGRRPRVLPLPLAPVRALAALAARALANPPLTPAMLDVLERDDCIDPGPACSALGLELTPLDTTLRRCLGSAPGAGPP